MHLIIFNYISDTENYILLGARYFYIPKNVLEFCSGKQRSYLETVVLSGLAFKLWYTGPYQHLVLRAMSSLLRQHPF